MWWILCWSDTRVRCSCRSSRHKHTRLGECLSLGLTVTNIVPIPRFWCMAVTSFLARSAPSAEVCEVATHRSKDLKNPADSVADTGASCGLRPALRAAAQLCTQVAGPRVLVEQTEGQQAPLELRLHQRSRPMGSCYTRQKRLEPCSASQSARGSRAESLGPGKSPEIICSGAPHAKRAHEKAFSALGL